MPNFEFTDKQWFNFICGFRGGSVIGSNFGKTEGGIMGNVSVSTEHLTPASSKDIIGFKIGDVTLATGSRYAKVPVSVLGTNITYSAFSFRLDYNISELKFISFELGEIPGVQYNVDSVRGIFRAILMREHFQDEITENKIAFYLTFEVLRPDVPYVHNLKINNTSWTSTDYTCFLKYVAVEKDYKLFFITPLNNVDGRIIVAGDHSEKVKEPTRTQNSIVLKPALDPMPPEPQHLSYQVPVVMFPTCSCEPGHTAAVTLSMMMGNMVQLSERFKIQFVWITDHVFRDNVYKCVLNYVGLDAVTGSELLDFHLKSERVSDTETRFTVEAVFKAKFDNQSTASWPKPFGVMYLKTDKDVVEELGLQNHFAYPIVMLNDIEYSHFLDSEDQPIRTVPLYQRSGTLYWSQSLFDSSGMSGGQDGGTIMNPYTGNTYPVDKLPSEGIGTSTTIIPNQPNDEVQESGMAVVGTIWSASSGLVWVTVGNYSYSVYVEPGPNRISIWIPYYSAGDVTKEQMEVPSTITIQTDCYILISAGFTWFTFSGVFFNSIHHTEDEYAYGTTEQIEYVQFRDMYSLTMQRPKPPEPTGDADNLQDSVTIEDFSSTSIQVTRTASIDEIEEYTFQDFADELLIVPVVPVTADAVVDELEVTDFMSLAAQTTTTSYTDHADELEVTDFAEELLIVPIEPVTADDCLSEAEFSDFQHTRVQTTSARSESEADQESMSDFCAIEKI